MPDKDAFNVMVSDLEVNNLRKLRKKGVSAGLSAEALEKMNREQIIFELLKMEAEAVQSRIHAEGVLEIQSDSTGTLRTHSNFLPGAQDIVVSSSLVTQFNLKTGDAVSGPIRPPKDDEEYFSLIRVATVNDEQSSVALDRMPFDHLVSLYPYERLNLETADGNVETRMMHLFCPIGKGQRGLIVSPPGAGKTVLLMSLARAMAENHPELALIVLLIGGRPEEVTYMQDNAKVELVTATASEEDIRQVQVAEMVMERGRRLVEQKEDVVILLDSVTNLAGAYNRVLPASSSNKILSGGIGADALQRLSRFFCTARKIQHGGSLTIVASASIGRGNSTEMFFEHLRSEANMVVTLDGKIADRRIYPAINLKQTATRKEELLLSDQELAKLWVLRKALGPMDELQTAEFLIEKMRKTKTNDAFLRSMKTPAVGD